MKRDNGKRMREKSQERARWLEGNDDKGEHPSSWHEERDGSRNVKESSIAVQTK